MKKIMITVAVLFLLTPLFFLFIWKETSLRADSRLADTESAKEEAEKEVEGSASNDEADWWLLAWRRADGQLPAGNPLPEPLAQRQAFLNSQVDSQGFGNDGTARLHWVQRGPQNVGGRTRALVIHPTSPNIMWAGSASGGVWKTTDYGSTWFPMNGKLGNLGIGALAIHPDNPNILYAGTG